MLDLETRTDKELFELLHSTDTSVRERVFSFIYEKHGPKVCDYCIRSNSSDMLGEDIFHDTMIRFYERIDKYDGIMSITAFLIRIARNIMYNYRKRSSTVEYSSKKIQERAVFEELEDKNLDDDELKLRNKIRKAVHQLPEEMKEPFLLQVYSALTYQEIADELELTVPTVRNRIMRAKLKLRSILTPYLNKKTVL